MQRCFNPETVQAAISAYDTSVDLDAEKWLDDYKNIALSLEDGSISMFEYEREGVYSGHYFFALTTRGKKAKEAATEMLTVMYDGPAEVIKGLTPIENLPARVMSAYLGFTSYGIVDTAIGPCELFIQTRHEFRTRKQ